NPHMPHFRLLQPVNEFTVCNSTRANAGPDGNIHEIAQALSGPPSFLSERRGIDIGIENHADTQRSAHRAGEIEIAPAWLGCRRNVAGLQLDGSERAD